MYRQKDRFDSSHFGKSKKENITYIAKSLWINEGKPNHKDLDFWLEAERIYNSAYNTRWYYTEDPWTGGISDIEKKAIDTYLNLILQSHN